MNRAKIIDEKFTDEIVEVAPRTRYIGCTFTRCLFVGCGPTEFKDCNAIECVSQIRGAEGTWNGTEWDPR